MASVGIGVTPESGHLSVDAGFVGFALLRRGDAPLDEDASLAYVLPSMDKGLTLTVQQTPSIRRDSKFIFTINAQRRTPQAPQRSTGGVHL